MPSVTETFVQAIFVLVTFVHIRNISAVTDPILTKRLGPNFLQALTFLIEICLPKICEPKIFEKKFLTKQIRAAENWVEKVWPKLGQQQLRYS